MNVKTERSRPRSPVSDAPGQWHDVAKDWQFLGPPLRPSDADVAQFSQGLDFWAEQNPGHLPRGLILGVTPELFHLPWPNGSQLRAVDRTRTMIDAIWPGHPEDALLADWRDTGLAPHSIDIVLCDGGLQLLDYPAGQAALCEHLARIVSDGGLVAFRLFVPPLQPESAEAVLEDLLSHRIPDMNCLKLRLGMALQETPARGVALADVWQRLRRLVRTDWRELADMLGWPADRLGVIDAYRASEASYHFVSVDCAIDSFQRFGFECIKVARQTTYPMAGQCPVVVFRKCRQSPG